jgi:hypothetical protein
MKKSHALHTEDVQNKADGLHVVSFRPLAGIDWNKTI